VFEWIDPFCWLPMPRATTIDDVKLWLALAGFTFTEIEET
jgi:hypothetical protein